MAGTVVCAIVFLGGFSSHAASQTWTNAPADTNWTTALNWDGGAYPGALNMTGNSVNGDVATFNQPIPTSGPNAGFGGAQFPITTANSTIAGDRALQISGIVFDTTNCGAYVFQGSNAAAMAYPGTNILFVSNDGSITMNSTVTNSQVFLVPIFIRLPGSTFGNYSFINNSTTPTATLFIQSVTNDSATTRGTTFILGGSNTGTNTIAYLSRGSADYPNTGSSPTADQGFTKTGTGTWIVQNIGGSDFNKASVNNINDGTLIIVDSGMWGASTNVNVSSNAVEQLINCGQTNTTMSGNATVLVNGASYLNSVAVGPAAGVTPHLMTTSSSDVLTVGPLGVSATSLTGGSATAVVNINGPGIVLLATNSTYDGDLSVDSGTLQVGATSALGTGPGANVAAGATLDLTPLGAGVTFNPTTLGIGGSGTGTTVGSTAATIKPDAAGTLDLATGAKNISLVYNPTSFTGDSTHPALYISQGTLDLGENTITVNNASGTALGPGTYVLVQVASGNINNAGNLAANVTGSGVASGYVGTISISGGNVDLVVAPYVSKHLIWEGGNPNDNWDNTTPNWFNGVTTTVFNPSDYATFNALGASNPIVNLVGSLTPSSPVLVDTTATNYVFSGSGSIDGPTSLTKMGTGTLVLSNLNTYLGPTVVSNGTIQAGIMNALSDNSDITLSNGGIVDLNTYSESIGALNGGGTVDTVAGGTPALTVGYNTDSGTFSGTIRNTAGTLALIKVNTGTETLAGANTYSGATTINGGTLRVANQTALGTSAVTVNSGTILDVSTNVVAASIAGTGFIENNSTTSTNQLDILGTSTINALIADGSGGGGMSLLIGGGTITFDLAGTYSGGTIVASGATLAVQDVSPSPNPGTGSIILSNNATFSLPGTGVSSANVNNTIVTVNNAEASFTSAFIPNAITGAFVGGLTSTDLFYGGTMTLGGSGNNFQNFTNFLGTVIVTNGEVRSYGTVAGGDRTSFDFIGGGGWYARDGGDTVHFGALAGDPTANISGPSGTGSNPNTPDNYVIGELNSNSVYSGGISGTNNIVKTGTGTLTLNGALIPVSVTAIYMPEPPNNIITFAGLTTISNGVLALVVPAVLTNSPSITLAAPTAVLDATAMGYISNEYDQFGTLTNYFAVTNSIFELGVAIPQTMGGIGTLNGNLIVDSGSTLNSGLPTGAFNVTSNATLSGAINMNLDSTNAAANSELVANTFNVNSSATLVVSNIGPGLINGSTFKLFNQAVSGFASVTLPATDPTGETNYIWQNWIGVNGTITLTNGGLVLAPFTVTPYISSIVLSGANLVLTGTNGQFGDIYYTLSATNLLLPVSQWTPVGTNIMPTANDFSITVTNAVNLNDPQQFFLLSNTNF